MILPHEYEIQEQLQTLNEKIYTKYGENYIQ